MSQKTLYAHSFAMFFFNFYVTNPGAVSCQALVVFSFPGFRENSFTTF